MTDEVEENREAVEALLVTLETVGPAILKLIDSAIRQATALDETLSNVMPSAS